MRYRELLIALRKLLASEGDRAAQIARELCAHAAGKTVEELLRDGDNYVPDDVRVRAEGLCAESLSGRPLAYILGEWSFYGVPLTVNGDVLIPRDDTMAVTTLAEEFLRGRENPRALDLCTGSGCIGIALAVRLPEARLTLADVSDAALRTAKANVTRHKLTARISVVRADARKEPPAMLRGYDALIANPPYITSAEMETLDPSVKDYEPHLALDGGADGLEIVRAICANYACVLKDGGAVCFEFGMGQETAVGEILEKNGFSDLQYRKDNHGVTRAVLARKNRKELE